MADMKLRECPSCLDGKATIDLAKSPMGIRYYSVVCKECGLSTKYWCESSKQKAFESWNQRATDTIITRQAERIKELEEALANRIEGMGWQPIESAPKDEDDILVIDESEGEGVLIIKTAYYYIDRECWFNQEGKEIFPSHWMPLPPIGDK